jgi:hypothetical protein
MGVSVGGTGVALGEGNGVALGWVSTASLATVTLDWRVAVISLATRIFVGISVKGDLVGCGVLVGRTIQAIGIGSRFSKVGCGVRVGWSPGRRCSASWVKAVLKMM